MISKKSRKVIAAVLIGATVCASGTFAYFNSVLDLNKGLTQTGLNKTLEITNGHVEITGQIGGEALADVTNLWYYDVSSKSAVEDLQKYAETNIYNTNSTGSIVDQSASTSVQDTLLANLKTKLASLGFDYSVTTATKMSDLTVANLVTTAFVNNHLSPDFTVNTTKVANSVSTTKCVYNGKIYDMDATTGTSKKSDLVKAINKDKGSNIVSETENLAVIKANALAAGLSISDYSVVAQGTAINPGAISLARPGDAIGLGSIDGSGKVQGLKIVNDSNITTKVDVRLKTNAKGDIDQSVIDGIQGLADAGWVLYVNDARFDFSSYLGASGTIEAAVANLQTELINNSAVYAPGTSEIMLNVKLELPLMTGNYYQDANSKGGTSHDVLFDVTKLFDIVATQENNPGVNEDGTNDPLKSDIKSNKGGTDATINKDNGQLREGTLD